MFLEQVFQLVRYAYARGSDFGLARDEVALRLLAQILDGLQRLRGREVGFLRPRTQQRGSGTQAFIRLGVEFNLVLDLRETVLHRLGERARRRQFVARRLHHVVLGRIVFFFL